MNHSTDPLFDSRIATWLEEDPNQAPDQALATILAAIPSIPQRRRLPVPWRYSTMSLPLRLSAAVFIAAVLVGGGMYLLGPRAAGPGGDASPSPSPSPTAQTATATAIDRTAAAGYSMTIPARWAWSAIDSGTFLSPDAPLVAGTVDEGRLEAGTEPPEFAISLGSWADGTMAIRGHDLVEMAASLDAFYARFYSVHATNGREATIDGEPAWVSEALVSGPAILWLDAIVIHGETALHVSLGAAPEDEVPLRAAFDELLNSLTWAE